MDFSIELAKTFLESDEKFPIEFDLAWQWLGYTRKDSALDTLKSYFEEYLDFSGYSRKSSQGGRPSHSYRLTVNCFKELGMLAKTSQGKLVRKYFLECERIAKGVIAPEPQQLQLPPADIRVANLIKALDRIGFDMESPRFNQGIKDITGDILGLGQSTLKPATSEIWCGVAERAEQLGHPVGEVSRKRSQLGKWVARADLSKKQETRLCNGTQRSVNLYLVGEDLDFQINSFFGKA